MTPPPPLEAIITVTLNPTIDRVMEVPGLRIGEHLHGKVRSRIPAGKAVNVSRALTRMGVNSIAAGWLGSDAREMFEADLGPRGVQCAFTPISGATRENITLVDPTAASEMHIRDAGPSVSNQDIDRLQADLMSCVHPGAACVFTGSCAPGLDPDRFGEMIHAVTATGAKVVLDSSGEALRVGKNRRPWMIKPNLAELSELMDATIETDEQIVAAAGQLACDIPIVLVTLGRRGAVCIHDGRVVRGHTQIDQERIRSTVGCGDAMLAGFLAAVTRPDWTIESALTRGLAASAGSAMSDLPADFDAETLRETERTVQLETLAS